MTRDSTNRDGARCRWTAVAVLTATFIAAGTLPDATGTGAAAAISAAAPGPPRVTLTAAARDLGTLGGDTSEAVDVAGSTVVGTADTAAGQRHAFAYDLTTGTRRDLGTLGGASSEAVAVDGSIVVGNSLASDGRQHAFAFDLAATVPTMRDLGALAGGPPVSTATDVDGSVVVGNSGASDGGPSGHAFAYDLSAAAPAMRDLGTGGWDFSSAAAVDDGVVVGVMGLSVDDTQRAFAYDLNAAAPALRDLGNLGTADYAQAVDVDAGVVVGNSLTHRFRFDENGRHPFAFDLRALSPRMRDLGDLGYDRSFATAGGQGIVAGHSWTARHSIDHAFAYDLQAAAPRMRDIGTLGGNAIRPHDVNDGIVVGWGYRAADNTPRAFAYDTRAARPELTDLGTLGGRTASASAVDGRIVAGTSSNAAGTARATVWTLRHTSTPALRFSSHRYAATESPHRVRVTVVRAGRTAPEVSVRYRASSATATAGKDFRGTSGVLRFAAGETRKSFYVSVVGDSARESAESVLVTLTPRGTGAILGTPRAAGVVIAASDQRADALISTNALSGFIGNDIISNGTRQTRTLTARRATIRTFLVHVQNDGNAANTFVLRGTGVGPGARVRYFLGSTDVTRPVRSKAGRRITMDPGAVADLTARVTVLRRAVVGSTHTAAVSATWRGDVTRTDVVRGRVRVVR